MKGDILPEAPNEFILFHVQFDKKNTIDEKNLHHVGDWNNLSNMMQLWIIIQKNH